MPLDGICKLLLLDMSCIESGNLQVHYNKVADGVHIVTTSHWFKPGLLHLFPFVINHRPCVMTTLIIGL